MTQKPTGNAALRRSLKKASPMLLTCLSAAGMVAAVIFAVKATPKAQTLIEKAEKEKQEKLTKAEIVKAAAPCYIPTVIVGTATLVCMFGACVLSRRQQTALIGAYTMLDTAYKGYREKAAELYGENADADIRAAVIAERPKNFVEPDEELTIYPRFSDDDEYPTEGKLVFYEEHRDEFFEMTMAEVVLAESHLNRNFSMRGTATLNELYDMLRLPQTNIGDALGWTMSDGYCWIDFFHYKRRLDDGMEYYIISPRFPPSADFEVY